MVVMLIARPVFLLCLITATAFQGTRRTVPRPHLVKRYSSEKPLVDEQDVKETENVVEKSKRQRFWKALPGRRESRSLDAVILKTAIPSMVNLAVVPLVQAVDTFWVGRMGIALALAGQAAANQAFFTVFFLVNYLPTITAPLVAKAVGSGNKDEARARVCESLFLSNLLGFIGTCLLVLAPSLTLGLLLPPNAPAMEYATPYLRIRGLSMVPALVSATGFAAFRGMLDTVTPLKVSLAANVLNLILDPLMIFKTSLGFLGAGAATAAAELLSGLFYMKLLIKRKLANVKQLMTPPSMKALIPLIQGGLSMLGRQLAINVALITAARRAQTMDPSGVMAAAYGIVMQLNSLGIVLHIAMQGTAAALIPSTVAKSGKEEAKKVGDRVFVWGSILGLVLGVGQYLALPILVPLFSTLPEVREAVKVPALLASLLHIINGPVFVGEGILLGLANYRDLMIMTGVGTVCMVAGLASPLGARLDGIMWSLIGWSTLQAIAVLIHYLKIGPLAVKKSRGLRSISSS